MRSRSRMTSSDIGRRRWQPDCCSTFPNDVQRSAINELIEQQRDLLKAIEAVKNKNEENHTQLSEKAAVFRRIVQSTETLREISTQMSGQITDWLERLDTEILAQELDQTLLSSLIPSTTISIDGWKAIQRAAETFSSILKHHTANIHNRIDPVLEQLHNAETLRDETADTLIGLSKMIEASHSTIEARSQGILHPLRRLPAEILLQIFEESVEDEADELRRVLLIAPGLPRMPITLSGVCRTWRRTVVRSPRLWSYIRLPLHRKISHRSGSHTFGYAGSNHFVTRARGVAIELTVLGQTPTIQAELTKVNIRRLNIANVGVTWPPPSGIPSPGAF